MKNKVLKQFKIRPCLVKNYYSSQKKPQQICDIQEKPVSGECKKEMKEMKDLKDVQDMVEIVQEKVDLEIQKIEDCGKEKEKEKEEKEKEKEKEAIIDADSKKDVKKEK